jgi:hypothetical protein
MIEPMAATPAPSNPATALTELLTRRWNAALPRFGSRWFSPASGYGQIMLVVAGAKPAATSLREHGSWDLPADVFAALRRAGFVIRDADIEIGGTRVVAIDQAAADRVLAAFALWQDVRDAPARRFQSSTALGLALGFPSLAVKAFARGQNEMACIEDELLPWPIELVAWWAVIGSFRAPSDRAGIAQTRTWLEGAVARFRARFPGAHRPLDYIEIHEPPP